MTRPLFHIFMALVLPVMAWSHEIRPGYLEIRENSDHSLQITWKQPIMGDYGIPLHPAISSGWMVDSLAKISYTESYLIKRWRVPAYHSSLNKQTISVAGLEKTITDVLVQVTLLNGNSFTYLIKPIHPFVELSLLKPQAPPVWQYIQLGIYHIWSGYDHLLFVFGLLLLVKNRKRLFWTITAFTMAHSITLALATLHIISVSTSFTETAIALSIAFLAAELLRHYRGVNGFAYYYPWLVSFLFGLLHGLGFASALQDVGVPENNIPMALFLFNVGVEAGQLAFVFVMLLLMALIRKTGFHLPQWSHKVPAYLIGTMAMYWFIERLTSIS